MEPTEVIKRLLEKEKTYYRFDCLKCGNQFDATEHLLYCPSCCPIENICEEDKHG